MMGTGTVSGSDIGGDVIRVGLIERGGQTLVKVAVYPQGERVPLFSAVFTMSEARRLFGLALALAKEGGPSHA